MVRTSATADTGLHAMRQGVRQLNPSSVASDDVKREGFHSFHKGGAQFVLADGSVRFISENIDASDSLWIASDPFDSANGGAGYRTYQRLFSRADGLTIGEF